MRGNRRKRPIPLFLLLEHSGEIADTAGKNAEMSAVVNKRTGGLRGKVVMVRAVAAVRVVATELHPGSKVDPHATTSTRKRGTSCSSAPSSDLRETVTGGNIPNIPIGGLCVTYHCGYPLRLRHVVIWRQMESVRGGHLVVFVC